MTIRPEQVDRAARSVRDYVRILENRVKELEAWVSAADDPNSRVRQRNGVNEYVGLAELPIYFYVDAPNDYHWLCVHYAGKQDGAQPYSELLIRGSQSLEILPCVSNTLRVRLGSSSADTQWIAGIYARMRRKFLIEDGSEELGGYSGGVL